MNLWNKKKQWKPKKLKHENIEDSYQSFWKSIPIFIILTLLMNRIIDELIEDNVLISHKISSRSNNRRIKRL